MAQRLVFLSYAQADAGIASALARDLHTKGTRTWIDQAVIEPRTINWVGMITEPIRNADAVVFLVSPHARMSRYVNDELSVAVMYKRPIYFFWIEGDEWMDAIPLEYSYVEYFDARGGRYAQALEELIEALKVLIPKPAFRYDVALSYAGEDRKQAEALAHVLKERGISIFYDRYEKSTLWGHDLYAYLTEIYHDQAYYCVMFVSKHYAAKLWPKLERQAALARALKDQQVYVLPIRLDDTIIPELLPTIAYIEWHQETVEGIADLIVEKLKANIGLQ